MQTKTTLPRWMAFDRLKPALAVFIALFFASYVMDLILDRLGVSGASTILNDLAIGILGVLLLLFYLSASYENHNMARARERMILVAELNLHVRTSLIAIGNAAMLENKGERLRRIDEAMMQIDVVLTDLVPTVGSATSPRLSLPGYN
jgi:hypothetical protein